MVNPALQPAPAAATGSAIAIEAVSHRFDLEGAPLPVLDNVSVAVEPTQPASGKSVQTWLFPICCPKLRYREAGTAILTNDKHPCNDRNSERKKTHTADHTTQDTSNDEQARHLGHDGQL
ncbi:hypothetical protein [Paracoccus mutanolyticus]|uniref:hypothetical protein n=1 Tax=Paracoccus mutanolyticus TaxID=1499308 RepID=UPI0011AE7FF6|nr:hypothetical protein [Paracoccus mutanolyticus]